VDWIIIYLFLFLAARDDGQLEYSTVLDGKGEIRAEKTKTMNLNGSKPN